MWDEAATAIAGSARHENPFELSRHEQFLAYVALVSTDVSATSSEGIDLETRLRRVAIKHLHRLKRIFRQILAHQRQLRENVRRRGDDVATRLLARGIHLAVRAD